MWKYRKVRQTTFVAVLSSSLLLGLAASAAGLQIYGWAWVIMAALLILCSLKKQVWVIVPLILAGVILGAWRGSWVATDLARYEPYIGTQQQLRGTVVDDPARDRSGRLSFTLGAVELQNVRMAGTVSVTSLSGDTLRRGDQVTVAGKLREGFGSRQASLGYAGVRSVARADDPILQARDAFGAGVRRAVQEPQASLGLGFIMGERSALPSSLDEQLKAVGLTHIVVASGYNLTILIRLAKRLLSKVSKYLTLAVSLTLMSGFLLVTGFSPSMSRAALVTGLVLWAWYYGRTIHPLVLILFAAAVTAFVNPAYLWSDVGWYLSFLSFAGVLLLAPLLQRLLFGHREVPLIGQILIETVSAQAVTLPLVLFIFGKLAVLSVLANILVVPFVPFAMLSTFIAGTAGIIVPALAQWMAWPADYIISYMIMVVETLAGVEWAQLDLVIGVPVLGGIVIALVSGGVWLWRRLRYDYFACSVLD